MQPLARRALAWTLIVSLLNPWAAWGQVPPPYAGDHLVYTTTNTGTADAPAILLLIDTSDSMNVPEPWREYDPDKYDSHVEYLWNSPNYINTISTNDPNGGITTAGSSAATFVAGANSNAVANTRTMRYDSGWFAGATASERSALKSAILAHANGTHPGDPGPRHTYRKYAFSSDSGSASGFQSSHAYIYWVPLEGRDPTDPAIENDPRLRSNSLNKFFGATAINRVGNTNPSIEPVTRGGIMFGMAPTSWSDPWVDASSLNQCSASFAELMPSTVYAPTSYPRNAGKMLDQRWLRWERWRDLDTSRVASYPGADTPTSSCTISGSGYTCTPGFLNAQRDARLGTDNPNLAANSGNDTRRVFPVVTQQASSHAGWSPLRPDLGGAENSYYRLNDITNDSAGTAYLKSMLNAQPGNTSNPASKAAGIIDYYKLYTPGGYVDLPTTATVSTAASYQLRKVRLCARTGGVSETDATGVLRQTGGTCGPNPNDGDTNCNDASGSCRCERNGVGYVSDPACASIPDPPACGFDLQDIFYTRDNNACAWSGRSSFVSKDYNACAWVGRQTTVVEGFGTIYYGGQCRGACSGPECEAPVNGGENYCTKTTSGNITISGVTYTDYRTDSPTAGCTDKTDGPTYWHGGVCQGQYRTAPPLSSWFNNQTSACSKSVTWPSLTIGGTTYYDVRTDSGGCSTLADVSTSCVNIGSLGTACNVCNNRTTSWTTTGGTSTTATVYLRTQDTWLYHDCKADDGSTVMRNPTTNPSAFGTTWNTGNTATNNNHSYSTNPAHAIPNANIPPINLYSVNYLNWKFGAKACRDASGNLVTTTAGLSAPGVTCKPIGRKTRLQIAKDALTDLVAKTNGVRFGLMVFNRMATAAYGLSSEGAHIAYKITPMGPKNCSLASPTTTGNIAAGSNLLHVASNPGFGVGNVITVPGAGPGGGNLTATINSITGNTLQLSANAATTVTAATIVVPPCTPAELAEYNNRAVLINKINSLTASARTPLTESLFEAYRYFRGEAPVYGRLTTPAQGGGVVAAGCDKNAFQTPGTGTDCTTSSGNYKSPMMEALDPSGQPAACQKNFVILVTDGGPEDDFSANSLVTALQQTDFIGVRTAADTRLDDKEPDTPSGQFETGGMPFGPTDIANNAYVWLDELAYYMANADMNANILGRQSVITYTIGFAGANTPVLQNAAARAGGQNYVADDADQLAAALTAAVASITAWNPTGGGTVPISALNRSENADDIYLAFFGPANSQSWSGTLKKFRLGSGSSVCGTVSEGGTHVPIELCLTGKTALSGTIKNIEQTIVDPVTGETSVVVNPSAVSFWNPNNLQDGARADAGGSGQRLRDGSVALAARKVFTFITNPGASNEPVSSNADLTHSSNAVEETNTTLITKTRLGNPAMANDERAKRIHFIRGANPSDAACADASTATLCTTYRSWPHHDVLHSKPLVVTYDPTPVTDPEDSSRKVPASEVIYYFSNDGLLHAVDTKNGQTLWSFLLEEAMPFIGDLIANLAGQHLMLADGTPVAWVHDANKNGKIEPSAGDKVYLFFGLRRAGRAVYALDVTSPTAPKFLWKIDRRASGAVFCTASSCSPAPDFDELGYTWSTPQVGRLRAIASPDQPALIFAGGYDPNQDNLSPTAADTMGRAVYVMNGATGALLKVFKNGVGGISGMNFSIPAEVAALNTDLDSQGYLDRIYVGDMAANLWRFDIDDANPSAWTGKLLAALSDPFSLPSTVPNRKIMTPPAVVKQTCMGQRYDAVYVGTGDREHPLLATSSDRLYMVKDHDIGLVSSASPPIAAAALVNITGILNENNLAQAGITPATWPSIPGWYLQLAAGEKVMSSPTVFMHVLRFSTYTPLESLSACVPPGKSVIYGMKACFGTLAEGTYGPSASSSLIARQYPNFAVRGLVPTGTVIVRDKKIYIVSVADGRLFYKPIGETNRAQRTYWYRQTVR